MHRDHVTLVRRQDTVNCPLSTVNLESVILRFRILPIRTFGFFALAQPTSRPLVIWCFRIIKFTAWLGTRAGVLTNVESPFIICRLAAYITNRFVWLAS